MDKALVQVEGCPVLTAAPSSIKATRSRLAGSLMGAITRQAQTQINCLQSLTLRRRVAET